MSGVERGSPASLVPRGHSSAFKACTAVRRKRCPEGGERGEEHALTELEAPCESGEGGAVAASARIARRVARSAEIGWLGRIGLAAQGGCFTVIAVLALALAAGEGGEATDPRGAFQALDRHAWTAALLVFLAFGFAAYSLWRLAQALFDRGRQGAGVGGIGRRGIQLFQALVGIGLTTSAVSVLLGSRGDHGRTQRAAAGVLGWPGGTVLVGTVGAGFVIVGLVNAYWGLSGRFKESIRTDRLAPGHERLLSLLGKVGFVAFAVVLVVIGWFLLEAALDFDSSRVVSLGGALSRLANAAYGKWLLTATAGGLLAFGLFELAQARYHRV